METVKSTLKEAIEMFDILLGNGQNELNEKTLISIKTIFQALIRLKKWGIKEEKKLNEALSMFNTLKTQYDDELLHKMIDASSMMINGVLIHINTQKIK